jgi:molybdopterin-guanine dinucleotide biosynthesis protein B
MLAAAQRTRAEQKAKRMHTIGIVGWKNSGKTTLVTRLITELRARGLTVSTIKHVHHEIDLDRPGKDTFRHREAGAEEVVLYSPSRWALLHERRDAAGMHPDLGDILGRLSPVDLVLVEGFKGLAMPKIEVRGPDGGPSIADSDPGVIAVATPDGEPNGKAPAFHRDDIAGLADFIVETITADTASPAGGRLRRRA